MDLFDLAHVAGWDPYDLQHLSSISAVGSVLHILRGCCASCSSPLEYPNLTWCTGCAGGLGDSVRGGREQPGISRGGKHR